MGTPLLECVMRDGRRVAPSPALARLRAHCRVQLDALPDELKAHEPAMAALPGLDLARRAHARRRGRPAQRARRPNAPELAR